MGGFDTSGTAAILAALGVGGLLSEIVRQSFVRGSRRLDEAASIRKELRQRVSELEHRLDGLQETLNDAETNFYRLKVNAAVLEEENRNLKAQILLIERRCFEEHGGMNRRVERAERGSERAVQHADHAEEAVRQLQDEQRTGEGDG